MSSPVIRRRLGGTSDQGGGGAVSSELYPQNNAASIDTEMNATTGWSVQNNAIITSDANVPDDGTWALKGESNTTPTPIAVCYFDLDTILTAGVTYDLTFRVRHVTATYGGGGNWRVVLAATTTGLDDIIDTIGIAQNVYKDESRSFVHSAATRYFIMREANAGDNGGLFLDNISIVPQ